MKVYLIRHCTPFRDSPGPDSERELNKKGIEEAKLIRTRFSSINSIEKVIVSPYTRAQQTFEEIFNGWNGEIETSPLITPYDNPKHLIGMIAEHEKKGCGALCFIAHQPLLGEVVLDLVDDADDISIFPGTVVTLEGSPVDPDRFKIEKVFHPSSSRNFI